MIDNAPAAQTWQAALAHLRASGASQVDPVRWHFLESLSRRTQTQQGGVRTILEAKLQEAIADFRHRQASMPPSQRATREAPAALKELNRYLAHSTRTSITPQSQGLPNTPTEMSSVRQFKKVWSLMRAQEQVKRALSQGPDNAGPLNSHMLVLRSLATLRELSPAYVQRFVSHAETLLWLEAVNAHAPFGDAPATVRRSRSKQ